jgi:WD40 repeat protein
MENHSSLKEIQTNKKVIFKPKQIAKLIKKYGGEEVFVGDEIVQISSKTPLEMVQVLDLGPCAVTCLKISPDHTMLAAFTLSGRIHIWDLTTSDYDLLAVLHDPNEVNIDEFLTGCWSFDSKFIYAAGKRKDRNRWCSNDDVNLFLHILGMLLLAYF